MDFDWNRPNWNVIRISFLYTDDCRAERRCRRRGGDRTGERQRHGGPHGVGRSRPNPGPRYLRPLPNRWASPSGRPPPSRSHRRSTPSTTKKCPISSTKMCSISPTKNCPISSSKKCLYLPLKSVLNRPLKSALYRPLKSPLYRPLKTAIYHQPQQSLTSWIPSVIHKSVCGSLILITSRIVNGSLFIVTCYIFLTLQQNVVVFGVV